MSFPSDLEIAESASIQHIRNIAEKIGISDDDLEYYGKYKAKIPLHYIDEERIKKSKLILVSAINPTPAGDGKTTVYVGLCDGLNTIGKNAIAVLREPSLGPVFGIKGGAAGGGYAQVIPMVDINLHFTGDFSAIEKANNLLSALIDNSLQNKKHSLNINPKTIVWKRVMDMNDRSLRQIIVGLGNNNGIVREEGFNITPASEVMAILCLSQDFQDLKNRLGNIFVGYTFDQKPIFARDLKAENAMAILLKDAIKPNLVQTLENNPAILHGGPFANIAQGTNTIVATKMGLSLADYVVTEAGFGADLGAEKFLHIKCHYGKLQPDAYVLVATVRALRYHGGAHKKGEYNHPNLSAVQKGFENLHKHIENGFAFGLKPIVAINHFANDSEEEIEWIVNECKKMGINAILANEFTEGGKGMKALANEVVRCIENEENHFQPLYDVEDSVENKIETIAKKIYGADGVNYTHKAKQQLKTIHHLGFDQLPICMAKTQKSLSDDEKKIGRPKHFNITVREFEFATGAGFIIPILGDMMRMPGLPSVPAAEGMNIDAFGKITGLS